MSWSHDCCCMDMSRRWLCVLVLPFIFEPQLGGGEREVRNFGTQASGPARGPIVGGGLEWDDMRVPFHERCQQVLRSSVLEKTAFHERCDLSYPLFVPPPHHRSSHKSRYYPPGEMSPTPSDLSLPPLICHPLLLTCHLPPTLSPPPLWPVNPL